MNIYLDFRDILIKPRHTTLFSRSQVNLYRTFKFKYSPLTLKCIPIMASNMDTVGTIEVMKVLAPQGLFTVLNKFISFEEYTENASFLNNFPDNYAISVGINEKDIDNLKLLAKIINFKVICIDVANGYMQKLVDFCQLMRNNFPDKIIMAGNVVCSNMTSVLIRQGKVDIVKVGIGGGSACTTRIKTGVGVPQLSAVLDCKKASRDLRAHIISDGGITCPGDVGKAFGAGADFVMIGGQFAGHDENPGEIIEEEGRRYKLFYGMSSTHAMKKNYGGVNNYRTGEGRCIKLKYRGSLNDTISDFLGGLRSLCTYNDCYDISQIEYKTEFIRVNQQFNNSLTN
jgi:GMP reductase